ncbi:TPA: hypothetical protein ACX3IN_003880 [Vibrio parahaemolyticus]
MSNVNQKPRWLKDEEDKKFESDVSELGCRDKRLSFETRAKRARRAKVLAKQLKGRLT